MSQENVELHHRANDAFNRRDLDAFLALGDPGVEIIPVLVGVEGGYRGHDGARALWRDLVEAFPDLTVGIEDIRGLGDATLARARLVGRGAGSDVSVERMVWHVMHWRNGKCVRWRTFRTESEALAALGLSE